MEAQPSRSNRRVRPSVALATALLASTLSCHEPAAPPAGPAPPPVPKDEAGVVAALADAYRARSYERLDGLLAPDYTFHFNDAAGDKIKTEQLTDEFAKIVAGSPEDAMRSSDGSGLSAGAGPGVVEGAHRGRSSTR